MIELRQLTKKFGEALAVDDISLTVKPGEVFGFLGPNGSGKTTTIKMITGIYRPTSGSVSVGGFDLAADPEKAKAIIGYIPDEPFVYEQLTGWEFLNFVGTIFGIPRAERQARIEKLMNTFPIIDVVDGYFGDYSRGTKQKMTILAALLHEPRVLVVDEPIVGLDPRSVRIVKDILKDFAAEGGTVFMSTHSLEIAESICTRIAIINRGRLGAEGSLDELRQATAVADGSLEDLFLALTPS